MKKYKLAVIQGRFHPFHDGHAALVKKASEIADQILILIGSSNVPVSYKNPWTYDERYEMIQGSLDEMGLSAFIRPLKDFWNNDVKWLANTKSIIREYGEGKDVAIVGFEKDASSFYLKMFPEHDLVNVPFFGTLSATDIREDYFRKAPRLPAGLVSDSTWNFLKSYYNTDGFRYVLDEYEGKRDYDKLWASAPFPPTFVTADNVVTWNDKILLVRRGGWPGKGLLALPGGFVDAKKGDSFDNAVCELQEETQIADEYGKIPLGKLRTYYENKEGRRFDNPSRSIRGFTLTTAFRMILQPDKKYKVIGSDDAVHADWYNFSDIRQEEMFEDHFSIIEEMI